MSTWKSKLRPASYRGVSFAIESHQEQAGGRRAAIHEYPNRNVPYVEDLGQKAQSFTLEAFVIGDDYMVARDALIDACNADGVGTLVHPYRGTHQVICVDCTLTEGSSAGGMARLSLSFQRAGSNEFPSSSIDSVAQLVGSADSVLPELLNVFVSSFSVDGRPDFVAASARDLFSRAGGLLLNASPFANNPVLYGLASGFIDKLDELIFAPEELGASFSNIITSASDAGADVDVLQQTLTQLGDSTASYPTTVGTTPSRIAQANNTTASAAFVRQVALVSVIKMLPDISFPTRQSAMDLQGDLMERIDAEEESAIDAGNFELVKKLHVMRSAMIAHVKERAPSLAQIGEISLKQVEPALVVSHRLFQSSAKADEIVSRNGLNHPLFVPADEALEVLRNG